MKQKIKKLPSFIDRNFGTKNPFELCELLGINVRFKNYNIEAMKGYYTKLDDENIFIYINSNLNKRAQQIVCAHELGHIFLHPNAGNHFNGGDVQREYEANLFAAYLLLNESTYDIKFENMNSYLLQQAINDLII